MWFGLALPPTHPCERVYIEQPMSGLHSNRCRPPTHRFEYADFDLGRPFPDWTTLLATGQRNTTGHSYRSEHPQVLFGQVPNVSTLTEVIHQHPNMRLVLFSGQKPGAGLRRLDKGATVRFRKPARTKLHARFLLPLEELDDIRAKLTPSGRIDRLYYVDP